MKKLLLLCCVFILNVSVAQPYLPILNEGQQWSLGSDTGWGFASTYYHVEGEEIINGTVYKIIIQTNSGTATSCRWREEDGVLIELDTNTNTEHFLLDFHLEIGDSFIFPEENESCFYAGSGGWYDRLVVDNITTEFIAGEDRKVMYMQGYDLQSFSGYEEQWIEGIGSTAGISPAGNYLDWIYRALVCFENDGETTFFNGYSQCIYDLGIEENLFPSIVISPNPVSDVSSINFPSEANIDRIQILDISGKILQECKVDSEYYFINALQFRSGLYFYRVYSENTMLKTDKFIIR